MLKSLTLFSLLAALPLANAQSADPNLQATPDQSQPPAPIVRSYQHPRPWRQQPQITESQPIPGVWLRSDSANGLKTISATPQRTEIRLDHGRLNVNIHQPARHAEILVDLPGGQTSLLKDGLYTFNADTNTVRVLHGEAAAWAGPVVANANIKPIKVKEYHQLALMVAPGTKPGEVKSVESYPYELAADLLPLDNRGDRAYAGNGHGDGYELDYPPYPYPYYADLWGYPGYYGYGYPIAYSVGFGYYGGFHGGGFRR